MIRGKLGAATHRPLGRDYDSVGLAGERAFAARYGYDVDEREFRRGDGGGDFSTLRGLVDVKTYRKPAHLLVEAGKERADIYVLARYTDATATADLLGWATAADIEAAPVSDIGRMGVQSRAIPAKDLRPVSALDALLGAWCVGCGTRVIGSVERRHLGGRPKPADFLAVCQTCVTLGWKLVAERGRV